MKTSRISLVLITMMMFSIVSISAFAGDAQAQDKLLIAADTCRYEGEITKINDTGENLSILVQQEAVKSSGYPSLLFHISKDTRINTGDFSDLKAGQTVQVYYSGAVSRSIPGQAAAIAINTVKKPDTPQPVMFTGAIREIYHNDYGLSFLFDGQTMGEEKVIRDSIVFHVSKETVIKNGKIEDLKANTKLIVKSSPAMTLSIPPQSTALEITITDNTDKNQGIKIVVDGKKLDLLSEPYVKNGHTMIPVRQFSEILGASVNWNAKDQSISIVRQGTDIKLFLKQDYALIKGNRVKLDIAPEILPAAGSTMVPLRFICENLDCSVSWDQATKTVNIRSK